MQLKEIIYIQFIRITTSNLIIYYKNVKLHILFNIIIKGKKGKKRYMFVSVFCHGHDICGYSNTNEYAIII